MFVQSCEAEAAAAVGAVVSPGDGLLLAGAKTHVGQCEALLRGALEACERYYQSFQFVLWAGKSSEDALAATMLETQGQA